MTRQDAIVQACEIMALAYHSIGEYSMPADGFCKHCPGATVANWNYCNHGHIFDYVRNAVLNQLKADGYQINSAFNPETGKPFTTVEDEELNANTFSAPPRG